MNLVISKCVTAVKVSNFTGDYLPNRSTLDIGVLGFFGIVSHKEHPPEVWSLPPVTPCICSRLHAYKLRRKHTRVTYSECATLMRRITLSSVSCPVLPYFPRYLINGTIHGGQRKLLGMKCVV